MVLKDGFTSTCSHGTRSVQPSSCSDNPRYKGQTQRSTISHRPLLSPASGEFPDDGADGTFPTLMRHVDSCRWIPVPSHGGGGGGAELVCPEDRDAMGYLPAAAGTPAAAPGYLWWYDPRRRDALHFYDLVRAREETSLHAAAAAGAVSRSEIRTIAAAAVVAVPPGWPGRPGGLARPGPA